ncbi:ABC transporter permease [Vannielia litorea]|uniref:ABC transporter permease n=1 Tax=Vannielia litorea TaxID=1217970 RepID=UPI001BCB40B5|nr:ABC transporter permease [Vannielia litorea]
MTEQTPDVIGESQPRGKERSQWADVWRQFRSHKGAMMGAFVLLFITFGVTFGPYIWDIDPTKLDIRNKDWRPIYMPLFSCSWTDWCIPPESLERMKYGWAHPLGTDNLGRDVLATLIHGGRVSIAVGWVAMALAMIIGTAIGVASGYVKKLDGLLMRFTDLVLALPLLPLLLVIMLLFRDTLRASFGPELGIFILIVCVIGATSWMQTARIVRADILALKEREFILAARSIGTPPLKMVTRHLLPNVLSPIMVSATLGLATAIITESAISFLGLGFPSDFPTWGKLLFDATDRIQNFPERAIWPGLMISLVVLAVNYIGDGLRDALDPRIRGR